MLALPRRRASVSITFVLLLVPLAARAQTSAFTYQGKLSDNGTPASGQYDIQFKLFDLLTGGSQQGATQTMANVTVSNGIFTVQLDFGVCPMCFDGTARFLEIAVKKTTDANFTLLSPRQPITSTPYALRSLNATAADGLSVACINCITSSQIASVNGSAITGTIPPASVPAGSGNYIQNQKATAQTGDFSISGSGAAHIFDAATQYNLGGSRMIGTGFLGSLFVGLGAGVNNTGLQNTFFGTSAGSATTNQSSNTFIGYAAGGNTGTNDPLGNAGGNTMVGSVAGQGNTTGANNTFVGSGAGQNGTTGSSNTVIGSGAGQNIQTGNENVIIGSFANVVFANTVGAAAIGTRAQVLENNAIVLGQINGVGQGIADTFVGIGTTFPSAKLAVHGHGAFNTSSAPRFDLFNTTANVGYLQYVNDSGLWQLGTTGGLTRIVVDTTGNVGIGTIAPQALFNVSGTSWFQGGTTQLPTTAGQGVAIGYSSGLNTGAIFAYDYTAATPKNLALNSPGGNVGIGTTAPAHRLSVIGGPSWTSSGWTGSMELDNLSAIAWRANSVGNRFGIGHTNGGLYFFTTASDPGTAANPSLYQMAILDSGNVGIGTSIPGRKLTVLTASGTVGLAHTDGTTELVTIVGPDGGGTPTGFLGTTTNQPMTLFANSLRGLTIETSGLVRLDHFSNQGTTAVCFTATFEIGFCSSSLRYKTNLATYRGGLEIVNRLRPISFDWKAGGTHDVGFGAEEVEKISPLLVTYNQSGQVEGVKYDRLSVVFVNAFKEQQAQIKQQQQENADQRREIKILQSQVDALRKLVCQSNPEADLCKP